MKNMTAKKRNYNTYYMRSDSNNHEAKLSKKTWTKFLGLTWYYLRNSQQN